MATRRKWDLIIIGVAVCAALFICADRVQTFTALVIGVVLVALNEIYEPVIVLYFELSRKGTSNTVRMSLRELMGVAMDENHPSNTNPDDFNLGWRLIVTTKGDRE